MDEAQAYLWLSLCPGLTGAERRRLLRDGWQSALAAAQARHAGPPADLWQRALRSKWVHKKHPLYPPRLEHLSDAPEVLFYAGDLECLQRSPVGVAVVGTRNPTPSGKQLAGRFGFHLAAAGVAVLSGMARGIDSSVHWSSLECPTGNSVAVVASGLDRCYPMENLSLYRKLVRAGLVLSEYPPGTKPEKYYFPARNRLIAALSHMVLVVEAPARSGALLTADYALKLGREVYTLPGPIDHPNYQGNLNLLEEGAGLARSPQAVVAAVLGQSPPAAETCLERAARPEQWAERLGLPLAQTLVQLSMWELQGHVRRDLEGCYRRTGEGPVPGPLPERLVEADDG
jgi:DNA processing protein